MRERASVAALAAFALTWFAFVATSALATPWPIVLADETVYMLSSLFGYRAGNFERWGIVRAAGWLTAAPKSTLRCFPPMSAG